MRKIAGVTVRKVERTRSDGVTVTPPSSVPPQDDVREFGKPLNGASKDALHNAAWYFGTLLCDRNKHEPAYGEEWPCKQCYGYAHDLLTEHATTIIFRERQSGKARRNEGKARKNTGENPGKRSGGNPGRNRGR